MRASFLLIAGARAEVQDAWEVSVSVAAVVTAVVSVMLTAIVTAVCEYVTLPEVPGLHAQDYVWKSSF